MIDYESISPFDHDPTMREVLKGKALKCLRVLASEEHSRVRAAKQ